LKEAELRARFLGPNKALIGQLEVQINQIGPPNSFISPKVKFESSTMALTNLTTFGVTAGDTVLAVEIEVECRY